MNNVTLIGRIATDINFKEIGNDNSVANFRLAVGRAYKQAGQPDADFIDIVVWGKQAENIVKYMSKGSQIGIEGRIQVRNYDNSEGKKVYVTEVIARSAMFLDSKPKEQQQEQPLTRRNQPPAGNFTDISDDELPF